MFIQLFLLVFALAYNGVIHGKDISDMRAKLEIIIPGIAIDSVVLLNNIGLVQVVINDEIIYFTENLQYLIDGDVISLETRQNITENKRISLRRLALANLDESDMIIYEPTKEMEHTITVFIDIDCAYCQKLHEQRTEYNDLGIRIRYLAFPHAGIDSISFNKTENVWCAENSEQAMTDATTGVEVVRSGCRSPVQVHYEFGRRIGVRSTPAILLESGRILPGYVPPKRLKQILSQEYFNPNLK